MSFSKGLEYRHNSVTPWLGAAYHVADNNHWYNVSNVQTAGSVESYVEDIYFIISLFQKFWIGLERPCWTAALPNHATFHVYLWSNDVVRWRFNGFHWLWFSSMLPGCLPLLYFCQDCKEATSSPSVQSCPNAPESIWVAPKLVTNSGTLFLSNSWYRDHTKFWIWINIFTSLGPHLWWFQRPKPSATALVFGGRRRISELGTSAPVQAKTTPCGSFFPATYPYLWRSKAWIFSSMGCTPGILQRILHHLAVSKSHWHVWFFGQFLRLKCMFRFFNLGLHGTRQTCQEPSMWVMYCFWAKSRLYLN